ncbi:MAG: 1-acyl-sn-glycerol-3-phosphate acyltransferase [Draconibacterium sp.]|nr:1-acyl-sn-glycerol-3-phosphate acyltransferase [Draconibacterium sp.]
MEENKPKEFKPIDIREVFKTKSPGIAKIIPGFIYNYLKRILHLDFLNEIMESNGHLMGIDFLEKVVKEFNIKEHIYGYENIPDSGRFIFASNHPLGGFDGILLMKYVEKKLGKLKFLTNDILMNIPNLRPMFIPVNKHGAHSREAAISLLNVYNSDEQILIFPSGLASRKIKGKIVDLDWKKHFISKSIKHKRDIIPIFIRGRNSNRFYRIAKFRKFFRIKWNLEMFFLPDETVKHRNTDIPIYFGEPIPYTTFDKSKTHKEWADWMKEKIYNLPNDFAQKN